MRRRILSMFLAILLVAALALNVSAASFYDWKAIDGYEYYATVNCEHLEYRAYTDTMCTTGTVKVEASAYALSSSNNYYILENRADEGVTSAYVRGGVYTVIEYVVTRHYANGTVFYNLKTYAS